MELTDEEKRAINALQSVAKNWPKTLWLFSASGILCVMKKTPDGERAIAQFGGMDQSYIVDRINIENDGGDW